VKELNRTMTVILWGGFVLSRQVKLSLTIHTIAVTSQSMLVPCHTVKSSFVLSSRWQVYLI